MHAAVEPQLAKAVSPSDAVGQPAGHGALPKSMGRELEKGAGVSSAGVGDGAKVGRAQGAEDSKLVKGSVGMPDRGQLSKQGSLGRVNTKVPVARKPSGSNLTGPSLLGKTQRAEGQPPTPIKKRLLNEGIRKVKVIDSRLKPPIVGKSLSPSLKAGSSLLDKRPGEVNSQSVRLKLGADLDIIAQKSKAMRLGATKTIKKTPKLSTQGLKLNKLKRLDDSSRPSISRNVGVKPTTGVSVNKETGRVPPVQSGKVVVGDGAHGESISQGKSRSPTEGLTNPEVPKFKKPKLELQENKDSSSAVRDDTTAALDNGERELSEPRKKIFNFPWHKSLAIALDQNKALVLQNLDPLFSSSEVENMLEEVLQVRCDVRMLPPKNFGCYTSGEAVVIFRNQNAAEEALKKLSENWLIWSKDERPVLASRANDHSLNTIPGHGFFNIEKFNVKSAINEDVINEGATSHCSQANTVEYEMALQWRQLQDRHVKAWVMMDEKHRLAVDPLVLRK